MSTASLRRDHDLIEKVINAMNATIQLLKNGKEIPEIILNQTIDFSNNFTDVCHHSKEENSLFPALEKSGMPRNMGPIGMMLMEHEKSRVIVKKIKESASDYFKTKNATQLIVDMQEYTEHITQHLWKENNRLFLMADARLQNIAKQVDQELVETEEKKFKEVGKKRSDYEKMAADLLELVSQQK